MAGLTWRTKLGMQIIAFAIAGLNHAAVGALPMLGMWIIWEVITRNSTESKRCERS